MSWFWVTLLSCIGVAFAFGAIAYFYRPKPHTDGVYRARAAGFQGIIRDTVKVALLGSGAGWLTSIYTDELNAFPRLQAIFLAALMVSLGTSALGFWMSVMADSRTDPSSNLIEIKHGYWFFVRGTLVGSTMAVLISILIAIIIFANSRTGA